MPEEYQPREPFGRELLKKREAGLERGKNVHVTVSFCRHEEPGKIEEGPKKGMSADFLTEQGIKRAVERGEKIPNKYVLVTGSEAVKRARQTAALELESAAGFEGMATAVNRTMPEREEPGFDKFATGEFIIYRQGDLDPVRELSKIWPEGKRRAERAVEQGRIPADQEENYQYEYYLDNNDRARELGVQTAREVAQEMAHRLAQCLRMSGRLYEGIDLNARNYSHGPRLESTLKHVLRQEDGKLGFDKLDKIGGAFKPGESFDLDVERDENGELRPIRILRGGKEIGMLDLDAVRRLEEEYKKSREKKE